MIALKEGFQLAQKLLIGCNMAPSREARKKTWWTEPWIEEALDKTFMAYKAGARPTAGEDGDGEVLREAEREAAVQVDGECELEHVDVDHEVFDDKLDPVAVASEEVVSIFDELLCSGVQQMGTIQSDATIVSPTVRFGENVIYKSTLVSQLNVNPFLSKDRLTKVKSSIYFNNSDAYLSAAACSSTCLVGLGSDIGVYFVQRTSTTLSSSVKAALRRNKGKGRGKGIPASVSFGVDHGCWWLGRIQKIRRKVGNRWGISRTAVDLTNKPTATRRGADPQIMVLLNWFSKTNGQLKFKYDSTDSKWIDIKSIITSVTMSFDRAQNVYTLDRSDFEALNEFVSSKT